jgi:hypothetical protein
MIVRRRSGGNVLIELRYGTKREEIAQLLEGHSIQYNDKYKHFVFSMSTDRVPQESELFAKIAVLNNQWWIDTGDGG